MREILQKISFNRAVIFGIIKIFLTAELFYGNMALGIPFLFLIIFIYRKNKIQIRKKRINELGRQFADALNSMAFAVEVGYSMENAVAEAAKDMGMMYGADSPIVIQLEKILHKIAVNISIEQAFTELAKDIDNEDIRYFAHIFSLTKRTGGNLISVITNTAGRINKKSEVKAEIEAIVSAKKMEQKIMSAIPYGIIVYLRLTGPEFISSLYGNLIGMTIMTVSLLVCIAADKMACHILQIEI